MLLVVLVLTVFGQCLGFEFVNYDDNLFILQNGHVSQGLTWKNVIWSLTAGTGTHMEDIDYWRPLSMMSHMLDVSLFGLEPAGHHAMSVGLHALTAVALFLVLRSMTGALWRSAFVAAVFAIHPLHVESVAWVAERKDVLSGLFFMLTLGAYTRFARRPFHVGNYFLVALLFALGLLSKPMLVTLPCVLLLLDYWPLGRLGVVPVTRLVLEKAPLFVMSVAAAVFTQQGPGCIPDPVLASLEWYWCVGNGLLSYGTYLWQMVWPVNLVVFYPHPIRGLALGSVALSVSVVAVITTVVIWQHRQRYLACGWFWYLGTLAPVIGFIQAGNQAHADRYTYLPLIGIAILISWAAAGWAGEQRSRRTALAVTALAALGALTVVAHHQTTHWRDPLALWTHTLNHSPRNHVANNNMGDFLFKHGRKDEAEPYYREAIRIYPGYADALGNLGNCLSERGDKEEGIALLRKAVTIVPDIPVNHYNLANALLQTGKIDEAIASYQKVLELSPEFVPALNNLGMVFFQLGRNEDAIALLTRVIGISPNPASAHSNLGLVLVKDKRIGDAVSHYETALKLNPDETAALSNLAWVLATCPDPAFRDGTRAVALARRARDTVGDTQLDIMEALAAALAETGNFTDALQVAQAASELAIAKGDQNVASTLRNQRLRYLKNQPWRDESMIRSGR
jgi:protein O-mannosyl-transferase